MKRFTVLTFLFILIAVIEVSSSISHDTTLPLKLSTHPKKKIKRTKGSVQYYFNFIATDKFILSVTLHWIQVLVYASQKVKYVKKLSNRIQNILLVKSFEIIHSKCLNYRNISQSGTCPDCLLIELPFYRTNSLSSSVELLQQESEQQIQQPNFYMILIHTLKC